MFSCDASVTFTENIKQNIEFFIRWIEVNFLLYFRDYKNNSLYFQLFWQFLFNSDKLLHSTKNYSQNCGSYIDITRIDMKSFITH